MLMKDEDWAATALGTSTPLRSLISSGESLARLHARQHPLTQVLLGPRRHLQRWGRLPPPLDWDSIPVAIQYRDRPQTELAFRIQPVFELEGTQVVLEGSNLLPPLSTWSNFRPGSDTSPAHWDPEDFLHWHVPRVGHTWAIAHTVRNAQQHALNGNSVAEAEGCHDIRPRAKARLGPKYIQLLEGYCAPVEQPVKSKVDLHCNDCRAMFATVVFEVCDRCRHIFAHEALHNPDPLLTPGDKRSVELLFTARDGTLGPKAFFAAAGDLELHDILDGIWDNVRDDFDLGEPVMWQLGDRPLLAGSTHGDRRRLRLKCRQLL